MSTANTQHYDVIIAGARCAGAATALLLARQGARVLVLDKSRYGTDTLSTHALMRGAVLQLHRWGLLPAVAGAGTPPVRSTTFHLADAVTTIPVKPKHGVQALYAPRRRVLDAILADAARSAGADVRFGASVTDLRRDRAGRVTGITGRAGGARLEASADLVIGADGRRSTVARCVGARAAHVAPASSVLIYRYVRDDAPDDFTGISGTGPRPESSPPTTGRPASSPPPVRNGCETNPTSAPTRPGGASWPRPRPDWPNGSIAAAPASPPRVFPGLTGYLREAAGPGWALVGDAGYFKDPITAHGITDALRDAEILARAVASGGPDAVGRYQAERDELSLRLFRVTGRIASFDWTADEIGGHLLELGEAMAEEAAAMSAGDPGRRLELASA